jgi:hypothetical protein
MTMQLLAEVGGGGNGITISVAAITAAGIAIAAVVKSYRAGIQKGAASTETTIKKPVPTVTIREEAQWATKPELDAHVDQTREHFKEVWDAIQTERGIARTALSRIHERLDVQAKVTATMQGAVEQVGKNVDRLLNLALNRKQNL